MNKAKLVKIFLAVFKILLSGAGILLLLALLLWLEFIVALEVLAYGITLPSVTPHLVGLAPALGGLNTSWTNLLGHYLFLLGLSSSLCEIVAKRTQGEYKQTLNEGLRASLAKSAKIFVGGTFIAIFLSIFTSCGRHPADVMYYVMNENLLTSGMYWDYFLGAMRFDANLRVSIAASMFIAVSFVVTSISFVVFIWSVGFLAVLRMLIGISGRVAKLLGLEGAAIPIASIIMSVLGMVLGII